MIKIHYLVTWWGHIELTQWWYSKGLTMLSAEYKEPLVAATSRKRSKTVAAIVSSARVRDLMGRATTS